LIKLIPLRKRVSVLAPELSEEFAWQTQHDFVFAGMLLRLSSALGSIFLRDEAPIVLPPAG